MTADSRSGYVDRKVWRYPFMLPRDTLFNIWPVDASDTSRDPGKSDKRRQIYKQVKQF